MGIFSKFEGRVEDTFEGAANKMFDSPISPVQIAKKAEKQMRREKMVGAGKQYAPTLYTVLVSPDDDQRLFGYYPTLAGETETYLSAKAVDEGLAMDGQPLVRFIVDDSLRRGKFEVIAELVAAPIIEQLRDEEMTRYGIKPGSQGTFSPRHSAQNQSAHQRQQMSQAYSDHERAMPHQVGPDANPYGNAYEAPSEEDFQDFSAPLDVDNEKPPLPFVPNDELDYSIDYGEYTFDSQDFEDHRRNGPSISESFHEEANVGAPVHRAPSIETPNTVVFASGSGNARPTPDSSLARASLMNTTDRQTYDLATSRLLLGRDRSNNIVVDDINASRTHAELKLEPQGVWVITDLGSTNGTLVNGREVNSHVLRDGDYITIGMTNYVFVDRRNAS